MRRYNTGTSGLHAPRGDCEFIRRMPRYVRSHASTAEAHQGPYHHGSEILPQSRNGLHRRENNGQVAELGATRSHTPEPAIRQMLPPQLGPTLPSLIKATGHQESGRAYSASMYQTAKSEDPVCAGAGHRTATSGAQISQRSLRCTLKLQRQKQMSVRTRRQK
jgi:hypothetical protein